MRSFLVTSAASLVLLATQAIMAAAPPQPAAPKHRASVPAHRQAHVHVRARRVEHSTPAAKAKRPAAALPPVPAQPKLPNWPVNNPPQPASVVLHRHELRIEADNSSLMEILNAVSAATGAKIEGLSSDERIFGSYGPGQVRDVLSQLLDGSGYNVMILGGQDPATPLRIVLSGSPRGGAAPAPDHPASNGNEDSGAGAPSQPPPMIRTGFGPGVPPRTQREMMQEIEQRQQEIEQRQQMQERQVRPN